MAPQTLLEIAGLPVTDESIQRLNETSKVVKEDVADEQSEFNSEFDELIVKVVDPTAKAAFVQSHDQANQAFADAYYDEDEEGEGVEYALDALAGVLEELRQYISSAT